MEKKYIKKIAQLISRFFDWKKKEQVILSKGKKMDISERRILSYKSLNTRADLLFQRNKRPQQKYLDKLIQKVGIFLSDHWHLLTKSAAENHIRIQAKEKKLSISDRYLSKEFGIHFNSYTHLKRYQKKVRILTVSASSTIASMLVAMILIQVVFPGSVTHGATFHFQQTNWNSQTVNTAVHGSNQTGWDQYQEEDPGIVKVNSGNDLQLQQIDQSSVQTSDTDFNSGTKTDTVVSGTGNDAAIKLAKDLHVNEYTVGHLANVGVTVTAVGNSYPYLLTLSGTPNLSRIFKNDKFVDNSGKAWKVLSLNPSATTPRLLVIDSEGNGGSPATGSGTVGRWYGDLAAWESDRQGDLVSRNATERALPYWESGQVDITPLVIDGWVVDANHHVEIIAPLSERHRGMANTGYVMDPSDISSAINSRESYTVIDGLEIKNWSATGYSKQGILVSDGASFNVLRNNLLHDNSDNAGYAIGILSGAGGSNIIYNNIVYNIKGEGIRVDNYSAGTKIYNNSVYNSSKNGILACGSHTIKNNISAGNTEGDFYACGGSNIFSNNISMDATATGSGSLANQTLSQIAFKSISTGFEDLHLEFNSTAKNAGVDLSSSLTTDIDGDTRSGTWDVGADDVGAAYVHTSSIGTNSRDFSTLQAWEDARDGVLTTRSVFNIASQSGAFTPGETITGTSGATGTYIPERATPSASEKYMTVDVTSGIFLAGDILTGGSSGKTATLSSIITTSGTIEKGEAYNDSVFTAPVTISGSTVDVNHYMWLSVEPRSRHWGVAGTGVKLTGTTQQNGQILVNDAYGTVEWFEITDWGSHDNNAGIGTGNSILPTFRNLIIHDSKASYAVSGIFASKFGNIYNNYIYNIGGNVIKELSGYGPIYIHNNSAYNYGKNAVVNGIGLGTSENGEIKNNIVLKGIATQSGSVDYLPQAATQSNNISSDSSATGTGSLTDKTLADVRFVSTDPSLIDLHLMPSSVARNAGADLSATFKSDIDQQTRQSGVNTWDIGADQWQGSSPVYKSSGTFESASIDLGVKANLSSIDWNPTLQDANTKIWAEVAANNDNATWNYKPLNEYQYPQGVIVDEKLVRQDCTGYSNCFTTVSAALAAYSNKDLVAQNKVASVKIDGYWTRDDITRITIDAAFITDTDHFVRIYTSQQARASAKWNNNKYRLVTTAVADWQDALRIHANYVKIDGLQIKINNGEYKANAVATNSLSANNKIEISNNIITSNNPNSSIYGIYGYGNNTRFYIWNNILYDLNRGFGSIGVDVAFLYNNIIYNVTGNAIGSGGGNNVTIKNNAAFNCGLLCYANDFLGGSNNASSDATANQYDLFGGLINLVATNEFADVTRRDFHLKSTSVLKNAGLDLNADSSLPFNVDIENHMRPTGVGTWDIGVAEYGSNSSAVPESLSGNRYIRYKLYQDTSDIALSPSLSDLSINYSSYPASAALTSSSYDTTDAANVLAKLQWTESLNPNTDVGFQVRTSGDNSSWNSWIGPDGTSSTEFTDPSGGELTPSLLRDGADDKYFQYKVILKSDGTDTPTLSDVDVTYVVNASPQIQNVNAAQNSDGTVTIGYEIKDPDTLTGSLHGFVNTILQYCNDETGACSNENDWINTATTSGDIGMVSVAEDAFTDHSVVWTPKTDFNNQYFAGLKMRIVVNDNEAANNLAYGISNEFVLDTKSPTNVSFSIDRTKTTDQLSISTPNDDSSYKMQLSTFADFHDATYQDFASQADISNLGSDPVTIYLKIKDDYGNSTSASLTTPIKPQNVVYYDVSNEASNDYREFIAWSIPSVSQVGAGFGKYSIFRSTDNENFSKVGESLDRNNNFYMDNGLDSSNHYYYKVTTDDVDGNVSAYSSVVDDIPNGQGGSDATPPTITDIHTNNITTTSATITWTTDELSDSSVGYSGDTSYLPEMGISSMTFNHSVTLSALTPDTTYNIRLKSRDVIGNLAINDSENVGENAQQDFVFTTNPGPAISQITIPKVYNTQAKIDWKTTTDSTTAIQYSSAIANGELVDAIEIGSPDLVKDHSQLIQNLTENTQYYFLIKSIDAADNIAIDNNGGNFYSLTTTQDLSAPEIFLNVDNPLLLAANKAVVNAATSEPSFVRVAYKKDADADYSFTDWEESLSAEHTFVLDSLDKETTYDYYFNAKDINGNLSTSSNSTFVTKQVQIDHPDLVDPGEPAVLSYTDSEAVIYINANTDSTSQLCYSKSSISDFDNCINLLDDSLISRTHVYVISLLDANTKYYYRIKTVDSQEGSNYFISSNSSFTTKKTQVTEHDSLLEISTPTDSEISKTDNFAFVSWETDQPANSHLGCTTNQGGPYNQRISENLLDYSHSHTLKVLNLDPDTKYYCQVISVDDLTPATTKESDEFSFVTDKDPQFAHDPLTKIIFAEKNPSILTDTNSVISFTTDQSAKCFVEYGIGSEKYDAAPVMESYQAISHNIQLIGLLFNTKYFYKVTCSDNLDTTVSSDEKSFTTEEQLFTSTSAESLKDHTSPSITNVNVSSITGESVTITWDTDEKANSLIGLGILNSDENSAGDMAINKDKNNYATSHSVVVNGLIPATKYLYRIVSADVSGNISQSSESTFTTASPSSLSSINVISNDLGQATVIWRTGKDTTSIVEYGMTTSYGEKKEDSNFTKEHSINLSSLNQGQTYHYRVKGKDKDGQLFSSSDNTFQPKSPPKIVKPLIDDVNEHDALVSFITDVATDANVVFTDTQDKKITGSQGKPELSQSHKIKLTNLEPGVTYSTKIIVRDEQGTQSESQGPGFTTKEDKVAPVIDNIKTDSALTQSEKVQAIISWKTDEQATTSLIYKEGRGGDEKETRITNNLSTDHVAVMTSFKSGTAYFFKVKSTDASGNIAISSDFALLTPQRKENIIQIIMNNFIDIFRWAKR